MDREVLAGRIRALIDHGIDGDQAHFNELAPELFDYQYRNNAPYRQFCDAKGLTPDRLSDWRSIPAFPSDAFKADLVVSFPMEKAVMAQLTSGTTASRRGQIFRDEIGRELVFTANRQMTGAYLFPDYANGQRCRILILAPSPQMAPSMGMAIGMEQTRLHFGSEDSQFVLDKSGINIKALIRALEESERDGMPIAMIGSTSAFVVFFNACREKGWRFELPEGSRIGDGGGYRGRFGEMTREDYFQAAWDVLGIPPSHCVNVLGMAESATNYFENTLRDHALGLESVVRHRLPPPWTRTLAVSTEDLSPLPHGHVGLLRHYDLANLPTVLGVQTDNLGYTDEYGGFQIVGRAQLRAGKVSRMPSVKVVGPMGDKPVFRFLETYVNFSIRFKMGLYSGRIQRDLERPSQYPPACPCAAIADEMLDADK